MNIRFAKQIKKQIHGFISIALLAGLATNCASPNAAKAPSGSPEGSAERLAQKPAEKPAAAETAPPAVTQTPALLAHRQRTDPPPKPDISCKKTTGTFTDTRLLEIEEVKTGCWLFYVNKEIKKRTAWSPKGNAHCERVRDQIRSSLEKAGYKCAWL